MDFQNQERAVEAARKVNSTNAPVEFVVHSGGHAYPNDAPEKIIAFFKQQARKQHSRFHTSRLRLESGLANLELDGMVPAPAGRCTGGGSTHGAPMEHPVSTH